MSKNNGRQFINGQRVAANAPALESIAAKTISQQVMYLVRRPLKKWIKLLSCT